MKINSVIQRIFFRLSLLWAKRTVASYCYWLRKKGVSIGDNVYIARNALIDITRPSLISIGNNCFLNSNVVLLTHDFVSGVFLGSGRSFLNSSGRIIIGNNVRFGQKVMVLKGVTIGDNCFIGAGSIVTKDIPANSVAVGSPCRVVMSIEEYFQKRLQRSEEEALDYARSIWERYNRKPKVEEMTEEFIWFVSGDEVQNYPMIPIKKQLGPTYNTYIASHKAKYKSFDEFLMAAGIK